MEQKLQYDREELRRYVNSIRRTVEDRENAHVLPIRKFYNTKMKLFIFGLGAQIIQKILNFFKKIKNYRCDVERFLVLSPFICILVNFY